MDEEEYHPIMRNLGIIWSLGSLLSGLAVASYPQSFQGSVRVGHPWKHAIGNGLELMVSTSSIQVVLPRTATTPAVELARCVTLPLHGPNPLDIEPWELKLAGKKSAVFKREFSFTVTSKDNVAACQELDALAEGRQLVRSDGVIVIGLPDYRPPPLGSATLQFSNVRLNFSGSAVQSFDVVAWVKLPTSTGIHKKV